MITKKLRLRLYLTVEDRRDKTMYIYFAVPPSFTSKPVDQTVKEGDETTLHCTATGNPTPNITWIKDGMAVAFGETFKFSANRTKSGTYWCSVENGLNVAVNTSVSLDVQCMYLSRNEFFYNPLHPSISMHILHTVLSTFPKVLTRRICLTIKSFFSW